MSEDAGGVAGRFVRERGTLRVILTALGLFVLWYVYTTIHVRLLQQVKWPALRPEAEGLTVLGLRDKERRGYMPPYKAIESGRAWQIRRTDEGESQKATEGSDDSEEQKDRGQAMPAGASRVSRGEVVPMKELIEKLPTVLTGKQFSAARIRSTVDAFKDRKYWLLDLDLTDEGRSRFWQFSRTHDGERLAFILKGQVMFCPRITNMDVGMVTIDPVWDEADAKTMANFVNGHKQ